MRVIVTGATGHLGTNLVHHLVAAGHEVVALTEEPLDQSIPGLDGLPIRRSTTRICDPGTLTRQLRGADVVFNLAGRISIVPWDRRATRTVNVCGAASVALAALAEDVGRLVHVSSVHALRDRRGHVLDETAPPVRTPLAPHYDRSKASGEALVGAFVERGVDAVVVNPTGIVGPWDVGPSRIGTFLRQAATGRWPVVVTGGFDWVDVRDVVATLARAAERGRCGERYILGGRWASVRELATIACEWGGRRPPRAVPITLARLAAPFVMTGAAAVGAEPIMTPASLYALRHHRDVSSAKAVAELGHVARPLAETVADTLDWFERFPTRRAPAVLAAR